MTDAEATRSATSGPRSVLLTVAEVIAESDDTHTLVLWIPDVDRHRFTYRPGQFLTVRIPSARTGSVARCYSLASSPHTDEAPKVTIKRSIAGYASNWLCDNVLAGDTIEVLPPSGRFTPAGLDGDFLLWAAGSGITPVMSILKSVLAGGSGRVILCYANRDEKSVIFAAELRDLATRYADRLTVLHWLESVQGLPTRSQLGGFARLVIGYESFICGPAPYMAVVKKAISEAGVPHNRIHMEVFESLTGDPFSEAPAEAVTGEGHSDAAEAQIELDGQTYTLRWPRTRNLVDTMLAAGIDVPYSCREGNCGSCAATVIEGEVVMGESRLLEAQDIADGLFLGCQARPVTDELKIEF